jgi:hypothetical protein
MLVVSAVALCGLSVPASAQQSPHGKLTFACEECHTSADWKQMTSPSEFKHAKTGFALKGQHELVKCTACHTTLKFAVTGNRCSDCHKDVHNAELGAACDRCHSPDSWVIPDMIQRHSGTRFSLVGAHATASCDQCHKNSSQHRYIGVRTDCFGCHGADFEATRSPAHRAAGFSTDCAGCHLVNASRWGGSFDHSRTGFPLTQAHASVPCVQCHVGNRFAGTTAQCSGCHMTNFTAAKNPPHTGFPSDCSGCHSTTAWQPSTFDHSKTIFPLTGAHLAVACTNCHKNNVYAGLTTTCYNCHATDFASATNPSHSGFPQTCNTCHTTTAWQPASFTHAPPYANFTLTGAHLTTACAQCHLSGVYKGTPSTCGNTACHLAKYNATTNPVHTAAQFGLDCQTCHSTTSWLTSTFNHTTWFPISSGRHGPGTWTLCTECHVIATDYSQFSCIQCHAHSDQASVDRAHSGKSGYTYTPKSCYTCHPKGSS